MNPAEQYEAVHLFQQPVCTTLLPGQPASYQEPFSASFTLKNKVGNNTEQNTIQEHSGLINTVRCKLS